MPYKNPKKQRDYHREWSNRNKEWWETRRARNRDIIRRAKQFPCVDCNQSYGYWVMDFDHRNPADKIKELSKLANKNWSERKLLEEIAKCDLVCANCHRDRTQRRFLEINI